VASLQALAPILQQLANAGQALPQSLQVLLTYPFTDQVLKDIKGDYLNIYLSVTAPPGTTIIPPAAPLKKGTSAGAAAGGPVLPLPPIGATTTPSASPSTSSGGTTSPATSPPGSSPGSKPGRGG
jgi:phospholipid/cholesterol/gamma-HCH transport system substrate-binding protein